MESCLSGRQRKAAAQGGTMPVFWGHTGSASYAKHPGDVAVPSWRLCCTQPEAVELCMSVLQSPGASSWALPGQAGSSREPRAAAILQVMLRHQGSASSCCTAGQAENITWLGHLTCMLLDAKLQNCGRILQITNNKNEQMNKQKQHMKCAEGNIPAKQMLSWHFNSNLYCSAT